MEVGKLRFETERKREKVKRKIGQQQTVIRKGKE